MLLAYVYEERLVQSHILLNLFRSILDTCLRNQFCMIIDYIEVTHCVMFRNLPLCIMSLLTLMSLNSMILCYDENTVCFRFLTLHPRVVDSLLSVLDVSRSRLQLMLTSS